MDTKKNFRDSIVRAVALIGLLLVLLLGAWGIILLAFNLPTIAGNIGNSIVSLFDYSPSGVTDDSLQVSAPESVQSGSALSLSWNIDNANDYSYVVSYACKNGLTLKAPMPSGSYQIVPCSTPFNYVNATSKMTLVASAAGSIPLPATIVVSATKLSDGGVTASGSTIVSVNPNTAGAQPIPSQGGAQTGTTYVPANHTSNLYGYADLSVRIISVLPTSQNYNQYPYTQGTHMNVQFEVMNLGTNVAPAGWTLSAQLPVGYAYTYNSPAQQALYPGDKIVYTMGFNTSYQNQYQPYQAYPYQNTCYRYDGYQNIPVPCTDSDGNAIYNYNQNYNYGNNYNAGLVTITADPRNFIYDQNRGNNTASIAVPNYNYPVVY